MSTRHELNQLLEKHHPALAFATSTLASWFQFAGKHSATARPEPLPVRINDYQYDAIFALHIDHTFALHIHDTPSEPVYMADKTF